MIKIWKYAGWPRRAPNGKLTSDTRRWDLTSHLIRRSNNSGTQKSGSWKTSQEIITETLSSYTMDIRFGYRSYPTNSGVAAVTTPCLMPSKKPVRESTQRIRRSSPKRLTVSSGRHEYSSSFRNQRDRRKIGSTIERRSTTAAIVQRGPPDRWDCDGTLLLLAGRQDGRRSEPKPATSPSVRKARQSCITLTKKDASRNLHGICTTCGRRIVRRFAHRGLRRRRELVSLRYSRQVKL